MPALPRGVCPDCRADVALRKDGQLREHQDAAGAKCSGSSKLPVTDDMPAAAPAAAEPIVKLKGESTAKWRTRLEAAGHRLIGAKSNPTHDVANCPACADLDLPAVHPATQEILEPSLAQAELAAELPAGAWLAAEAIEVSPYDLVDDPDNARGPDLGDLSELAASLITDGMIQPVVVVPIPRGGKGNAPYKIVAGHRRVAAARLANLAVVPALVRADLADARRLAAAQAVENLQRRNLDPIQEAKAFRRLADAGAKQEEIANRIGVNQGHVSKRLSLLKLTADAQAAVAAGTVKVEDAVELARLPKGAQTSALAGLLEGGWRAQGAIARAAAEYEDEQLRQGILDKLTADGITVVDFPGWNWSYDDGVPLAVKGVARPFGVFAHAGVLDETPAKHKKCAGHVATITPRHEVMYLCTDPARHGIEPDSAGGDPDRDLERAERDAAAAERDARFLARRSAALTVAGGKIPRPQMGELLATATLLGMLDETQFLPGAHPEDHLDAIVALADDEVAAALLAGDDLRDDWDRMEQLLAAAVDKHGALRVAFAATVMSTCTSLRSPYGQQLLGGHAHFKLFFELLAAGGYELTDEDQAWLVPPVRWEPAPMPDEVPDGAVGWYVGNPDDDEDEARWILDEAEVEGVRLVAGPDRVLDIAPAEVSTSGPQGVGPEGDLCEASGHEYLNAPADSPDRPCPACGYPAGTDGASRVRSHAPAGADVGPAVTDEALAGVQ